MARLQLSFACWNYDRTRALQDGSVRPEGIDLNFLEMPVEETFFRMVRHREFDVSEMSLSSYCVTLFKDPQPFVAIPVFTSRLFRHSCIYVNAKAGIREPKDLIGKRIGVPEYQMTAAVWIRGILAEHFGVPVDSVTYFTGGEEEPGRPEKQRLELPASIKVVPIPPEKTLARMLAAGEIDALHTSRMPSTHDGKTVVRLFPNFLEVERAYYKQTGIFPIMHTVAVRRELYERHRWVVQSLYKAFLEAQRRTYLDLKQTNMLQAMVPWLHAHVEEAVREMGEDYWPYGVQNNRTTLETFLRYHHGQGLSRRLLKAEELFAPETLESFKV
ncbi:MAG TPA: ABC transporter substrate-binding protein [Hyphomicrobiaceae bacterium]|nr:ABC transporter substrate-binding protein [Hyphomicrobiaceae bacterium]